ncbi:hypothetical protein [Brevibacillus laterosporus]|uniref:hypothetical protein n=1 Tax=Brevibacillus laterosporus TaxID=1465 RepID=UPI001EF32673|nr:hypothetical protein [Brevibacillus laterosporus]MCG7320044.1 hypothetical protein [Brevibacillus laterosporus]
MNKKITFLSVGVASAGVLFAVVPLMANADYEIKASNTALTPTSVKTATASTDGISSYAKNMMPAGQVRENYLYNIENLEKENKLFLQMLLQDYKDRVYVVVKDPNMNFEKKLKDVIEEYGDEWQSIFKEDFDHIYLSVRALEKGFDSYSEETTGGVTTVAGKVQPGVTRVVITTEKGNKVEVLQFTSKQTFRVSMPQTSAGEMLTLQAYQQNKLVESAKLRIKDAPVLTENALIYSLAKYNSHQNEVLFQGKVKSSADQVKITYNGITKEIPVKQFWSYVGSFSWQMPVTGATIPSSASVEVFSKGKLIDRQTIQVVNIWKDVDGAWEMFKQWQGDAYFDGKDKMLRLKGKWDNLREKLEKLPKQALDPMKVVVTFPDGKKHEQKIEAIIEQGHRDEYVLKFPFKSSNHNVTVVHVAFYNGDTVLYEKDLEVKNYAKLKSTDNPQYDKEQQKEQKKKEKEQEKEQKKKEKEQKHKEKEQEKRKA